MQAAHPDPSIPADAHAHLAAEGFQMLADPTRVKILWALLQGESSVSRLAELVGSSPTAVSQHLAKLRLAQVVRSRREGTFVYYSAADDHVRRLLAEALSHAEHTAGEVTGSGPHRYDPAALQSSDSGSAWPPRTRMNSPSDKRRRWE